MRRSEPIRVLLAASEVVGFAKTGGLADVAGSLPPALARRGCDAAVILPLYRAARTGRLPVEPTDHFFRVPVAGRTVEGRLWRSALPDAGVPVYLVENAEYFDRDDPALGRGLYQFKAAGGGLSDYPDNCERFVFFCRAVLEAVRLLDFWPDVLHLNDWQTGLVPVFLREFYRHYTVSGCGTLRAHADAVHHPQHGLSGRVLALGHEDWPAWTGGCSTPDQLEFHGHLNCLKAGLVFADLINTVSPTYAREIQTPYFGCGLQGVLSERRDRLFGIVNGCDYRVWDPTNDPHLAGRYDADRLAPGKPACKAASAAPAGPGRGAGRPAAGRGGAAGGAEGRRADRAGGAGPAPPGAQLAVLGQGDPVYHKQLKDLQKSFPGRVGLCIGFDEPLAHQIEAGADLFLMPSFYEPSGLNQLYSMHYGTPPVVRATGGLADTVVDATPETLAAGKATGFVFVPYSADALLRRRAPRREPVPRAVRRSGAAWCGPA